MAQTQSNPYVINTSNTFFNTASFVTSEGEHVPNWPQIMPKLRRFWEEYAKYPINFQEGIGNDGDILRRVINEDVLRYFNEWQSITRRLEAAQQVLDKNLNNTDVVDLMKRKYMADMQRELDIAEAALDASYHFIYRRLRRAGTETWEYRQGPNRFKVHLSDEIRALCNEICDELTNGDNDISWT